MKILNSIGFFFIATFAIIFFIFTMIFAVTVAGTKELYLRIFQREKYKSMRKKTALERYYNYAKEDSLYY